MRVLHVTTEFPPVIYGGLGTAVGGLVNASARAGLTVGVLLIGGALVIDGKVANGYGQPFRTDGAAIRQSMLINSDGVEFLQVPWDNAVEPAIRLVREWRPDVVHLHTHWAWHVARAIREQTRTSLVYTVHSVDRAEYEFGEEGPNLLDRCDDQEAALAAADRIVALTRCESEILALYYPWVQADVRVVGNGIDDCDGGNNRRRFRRDRPILALYSGRLVDRKGIPELLASIPMVLARAPETRFVFAGGPAHCSAAEVERHWFKPELYPFRDHIHFTGWLSPSRLAGWYRKADVLIVPSRYEPFGMVVLEGMLHGLPIVAADVGGPREILDHERTGLLFRPKDVEALTEALLRLIEDPALRKRIGAAAAREVRQKWLWLHSIKKMRRVYFEAVEASAARSTPPFGNGTARVGPDDPPEVIGSKTSLEARADATAVRNP